MPARAAPGPGHLPDDRAPARWLARLGPDRVPPEALAVARRSLVDTVGVAVAGADDPAARAVRALAEHHGGGRCTALGLPDPVAPTLAALVNGTAAHALDFDDWSAAGIVHASAAVWPAVHAAVELVAGSGADLLLAFTAGVETTYRLGLALGDGGYMRGVWTTATLGAIGAAAGAAFALKLDEDGCHAALGIAAALAGGSRAVFGTGAKPYGCGKAAADGLAAALVARSGLDGPADWLSGRNGAAHLHGDGGIDRDCAGWRAFADDTLPWALVHPGVAIKTWPVCSAALPAADAALRLRQSHGVRAGDVVRIAARVAPFVGTCLVHDRPRTAAEARFSLPFALAAIVDGGSIRPADLRRAGDPADRLHDLMARVSWSVATELAPLGAGDAADVTITTTSATLRQRVVVARGTPADPLADADVADKVRALATAALGEAAAARLVEDLAGIDGRATLAGLLPAGVRR